MDWLHWSKCNDSIARKDEKLIASTESYLLLSNPKLVPPALHRPDPSPTRRARPICSQYLHATRPYYPHHRR